MSAKITDSPAYIMFNIRSIAKHNPYRTAPVLGMGAIYEAPTVTAAINGRTTTSDARVAIKPDNSSGMNESINAATQYTMAVE